MRRTLIILALAIFCTPLAEAGPLLVSRTDMTFGSPTASIPTDAVSVFTYDGWTLGLTAHERCAGSPQVCGDPVTNNGIDTFYAAPGTPFTSNPTYASWNFGFEVIPPTVGTGYQIGLTFAGPGIGPSLLPTMWLADAYPRESWNFGMTFLGLIPGFNPNAAGTYTINFNLYDASDVLLGGTEINVEVVPEPASLLLLGTGLVGLARLRKRRG